MLKNKIHRIPIVNDSNQVVGGLPTLGISFCSEFSSKTFMVSTWALRRRGAMWSKLWDSYALFSWTVYMVGLMTGKNLHCTQFLRASATVMFRYCDEDWYIQCLGRRQWQEVDQVMIFCVKGMRIPEPYMLWWTMPAFNHPYEIYLPDLDGGIFGKQLVGRRNARNVLDRICLICCDVLWWFPEQPCSSGGFNLRLRT